MLIISLCWYVYNKKTYSFTCYHTSNIQISTCRDTGIG